MDELAGRLEALLAEVAEVREEIARHPDNIRRYFGGADHPLVRRVTRVEEASGWTESRKNPCEWRGFRYEFDGVSYEARSGSNWCSTTRDVVKVGGGWNDRWEVSCGDPGGEPTGVLDGVSQDHAGVGEALLALNGFFE